MGVDLVAVALVGRCHDAVEGVVGAPAQRPDIASAAQHGGRLAAEQVQDQQFPFEAVAAVEAAGADRGQREPRVDGHCVDRPA